MNKYDGHCHCGAITFAYSTKQPPSEWSMRACQCDFCRAHDALSTSDPSAALSFASHNPEKLQRYRFAMKTADFLLCRHCGVYIGAVISTERGLFGIINTRALSPVPADIAAVSPINYDSEDSVGRIRRREDRWTPVQRVPWSL